MWPLANLLASASRRTDDDQARWIFRVAGNDTAACKAQNRERGLAWHEDVETVPGFTETVKEIKDDFGVL